MHLKQSRFHSNFHLIRGMHYARSLVVSFTFTCTAIIQQNRGSLAKSIFAILTCASKLLFRGSMADGSGCVAERVRTAGTCTYNFASSWVSEYLEPYLCNFVRLVTLASA